MGSRIDSKLDKSPDPKMKWMYEGQKSMVNREDYLLGKKIDKNFELFSDVVVRDKDEEDRSEFFQNKLIESSKQPNAISKVSALDVSIIRNEDPLVALKMKEEARKREKLENPLFKLKIQRVLKKAFEKEKQKNHGKYENKTSEHKKEEHRKRRRSYSHNRDDTSENESTSEKTHKHSKPYYQVTGNVHHHHHQKHKKSESDNEIKKARKDRDSPTRTNSSRPSSSRLCESTTSSRQKLTLEEIETRRLAMMSNVAWRDGVREETLKKAQEKLLKEEEEQKLNKGPSFIKPIISAASSSSVEKRLQTNKMNVQRSHNYMEKSFTKRE